MAKTQEVSRGRPLPGMIKKEKTMDKKWLLLSELLIDIVNSSAVYSKRTAEMLQKLIDEVEKEES